MPAIILTIIVSLLAGYGLVLAGVYQLAGIGWACVVGGVMLLVLATLLARGLSTGAADAP